MSQPYKAVIADDEPLLRQYMQSLLTELWPELTIVALAANGEQAWQHIQQHQPDVVFLDIHMPVLDGISLAQRFSELSKAPLTTFVTAYDQHAIEAFEHQAVDYLLKPIEASRLEKTIERLKQQLTSRAELAELPANDHQAEQLQQLLTMLTGNSSTSIEPLKWIKASKQGVLHLVPVAEVLYFLADSKYTSVVTSEAEYLIKTPIVALVEQLDADVFWKIHRNCIVNVNFIAQVERDFAGHMFVHLKNTKTKLSVSRNCQALFKQM